MNPLFAKLNSISLGGFVVAGALIAVLIHFMKLSTHADVKEKLDASQAQIEQARETLKKGQSLSQERPKYEQEIADTKTMLETATELMPAIHSQREIVEILSEKARAANVRLPVLKPSASPGKAALTYSSVSYDLEIEGDFTQIASFFFELTKVKNILHAADLTFTKVRSDGRAILLCKTSILAFVYSKKVAGMQATPGGP